MKQITELSNLDGKVIRKAISTSAGVVLVFDDNDWCFIEAADSGPDGHASIFHYHIDIKSLLDPDELVEADLLTPDQAKFLVAQQNKAEATNLRKQAEKLLDQAQALEAA